MHSEQVEMEILNITRQLIAGLKTALAASLLIYLSTLGLVSCTPSADQDNGNTSTTHVPSPPIVGDIHEFKNCEVVPQKALTKTEQCQIEKLAKRCLPADDCLVQCLSGPDGANIGGGCEHVCFSQLHVRPPSPPGWLDCSELPK